MNAKRKIGIMGGTFNPIHFGHLFLAQAALNSFELDEVLFIPSGHPPHKSNSDIVAAKHRKCMIEIAIHNNKEFKLSTIELDREGTTYTVDTLRELTTVSPDNEYYFIIGADSLYQFETWREPKEIISMCHILAATRYGLKPEEIETQIRHLNNKFGNKVHLLSLPTIEISSKDIRKRLHENLSIRYYVPYEVEEYIKQNNLYQ